ncbi:MAG: hypothetical protein CL609_11700 [Anaerolineaceae bacterium]|nr:hypothetical protein [Anaerolineaceae bacterium]
MKKLIFPLMVIFLLVLAACQPALTTEVPTLSVEEPAEPTEPTVVISTETTQPTENAPTETIPTTGEETILLNIVPDESTVTYEVGETFINQNNRFQVAVGVTSNINGEITANPANPPLSQIGTITIDISEFKSDSNRRDGAIRGQWLESDKYPIATFEPTEITNLPENYVPGEAYTFSVTGNLTVRETTKPVTFDVTASFAENTLTGSATTTILMSDFGVGPISILGILNTEDEVKLTFDFVARP